MDLQEQENLRTFLISLYGPQVKSWPMNDRMFNLTYELISKSSACSDAMDYVPRPLPPGREPIKWLTKEARNILLRKLKDRKEYYVICINTAALSMKTRFLEAANGL